MIILVIKIIYIDREKSILNLAMLLLNCTITCYEFINYKAEGTPKLILTEIYTCTAKEKDNRTGRCGKVAGSYSGDGDKTEASITSSVSWGGVRDLKCTIRCFSRYGLSFELCRVNHFPVKDIVISDILYSVTLWMVWRLVKSYSTKIDILFSILVVLYNHYELLDCWINEICR